mgnify:CR=1 FL=1
MKMNELNLGKVFRYSLGCLLVAGVAACGGVEETETADDTVVVEEDAGVMENWDTQRFRTSFNESGRFAGWDTNDDNLLDENEFYISYFDTWDVNDDSMLDEEEWNNAVLHYNMEGQAMTDWDKNKDMKLDESEFRAGMAKNNYYRDWDRNKDNMLDENEYTEGVFMLWDVDDDGYITEEEYNTRYNRYYGTTMK